jgi:hypothetical protein
MFTVRELSPLIRSSSWAEQRPGFSYRPKLSPRGNLWILQRTERTERTQRTELAIARQLPPYFASFGGIVNPKTEIRPLPATFTTPLSSGLGKYSV